MGSGKVNGEKSAQFSTRWKVEYEELGQERQPGLWEVSGVKAGGTSQRVTYHSLACGVM